MGAKDQKSLLEILLKDSHIVHCLEWLSWHYQPVLSWNLHQPESHQLSLHNVPHLVTETRTHRSVPRYTWVREKLGKEEI